MKQNDKCQLFWWHDNNNKWGLAHTSLILIHCLKHRDAVSYEQDEQKRIGRDREN